MARKCIVQAYLDVKHKLNIANENNDQTEDYSVILPEGYDKIIYVGIQGIPGIRIGLGTSTETNPIYLNGTGYFELNLENTGAFITGIYINKVDFERRVKNNNSKAYLIIDCIAVNELLGDAINKNFVAEGDET